MSNEDTKDLRVNVSHDHGKTMDEKEAANRWQLLRSSFKEILTSRNYSMCSFEELYTNAYNLVVRKRGDVLYGGLKDVITEHLRFKVSKDLAMEPDSNFLQAINRAWNDHCTSMNIIRDIVMYMDRVYVGQNNALSVNDLRTTLFREEVYERGNTREKLQDTLLDMVSRQRNGRDVDACAMQSACKMLVDFGLNSRSVYEEDFEKAFLHQSAEYYRAKSVKLLAECNAAAYATKVADLATQEEELTKKSLDETTATLIASLVEREMTRIGRRGVVGAKDRPGSTLRSRRLVDSPLDGLQEQRPPAEPDDRILLGPFIGRFMTELDGRFTRAIEAAGSPASEIPSANPEVSSTVGSGHDSGREPTGSPLAVRESREGWAENADNL